MSRQRAETGQVLAQALAGVTGVELRQVAQRTAGIGQAARRQCPVGREVRLLQRELVERRALEILERAGCASSVAAGQSVKTLKRTERILARADVAAQDRWRRRIYPNLQKKPERGTGL